MNKAEKWLRSQKYTPDLMFSWELVIRALTEFATQKHIPTDEEVITYIESINCGDAYKVQLRWFWQWLKGQINNGYDQNCFHECPQCNSRCNCSYQPCSCCKEQGYKIEFAEWMLDNNISANLRDKKYLYGYPLMQLKNFKGDCTLDELFTYYKSL